MKIAGIVVLMVAALLGLPWLFLGNDYFLYRYFAPKQEAVRRQTFEQSKAYRQGMVQELQNMQFEYVQAKPEHQAALRSLILRRAADIPADALTSELNSFIAELRREQ